MIQSINSAYAFIETPMLGLTTPLSSFLAIAKTGNLTRAARSIHLTQPAVSAQLARLEEEVGAPLFHRTAKGMDLTEAGVLLRRYVEEAELWLEDGRAAVSGLAALSQGKLSIGAGATATTYLLPPLLRSFHERHPGIQLHVREQGSKAVAEAVLAGTLDLGVVTLPVQRVGAGRAKLTVTQWRQDELRLITPPNHPLRNAKTFTWSDLQDQPLVMFEAGTAVRRLIDDRLAYAEVDAQIVMELRSIESIKRMVAEGIGAAFVSQYALNDREGLSLCTGPLLQRELAVISREDRMQSAAATAFMGLMGTSI